MEESDIANLVGKEVELWREGGEQPLVHGVIVEMPAGNASYVVASGVMSGIAPTGLCACTTLFPEKIIKKEEEGNLRLVVPADYPVGGTIYSSAKLSEALGQ